MGAAGQHHQQVGGVADGVGPARPNCAGPLAQQVAEGRLQVAVEVGLVQERVGVVEGDDLHEDQDRVGAQVHRVGAVLAQAGLELAVICLAMVRSCSFAYWPRSIQAARIR